MRKVKRAMTTLRRMDEPEEEPSGIIDRPLDTAIRGFQRDKGLRVDGFMRPDGPTRRSLQSDLLGFLREEKESDRGDGSDGLRSRSLNPAAALRHERDSRLSNRNPERRDLSFDLLEIADRALFSSRTSDSAQERDRTNDRPLSKGRDRLESNASDTRPNRDALATNDAASLASNEAEPARLKPFLDKAERNLRRTVEGWRKEGMTDAARHLQPFLDGSGEPITYNRDRARSVTPPSAPAAA